MLRYLPSLASAALLAACEGSTDSSAASDDRSPNARPSTYDEDKTEAFRFLNQTTFGATESAAAQVIESGYEAWIEDQFSKPASLQLPYLLSLPTPNPVSALQADRIDIWFRNAIDGEDQLRQRVAFALSQLFVVSELGSLSNMPYALASYYDLLAEHAFGNFRALLEAVTLHPAMGVYLGMLGNAKPDPASNRQPDENFARELLQLFTIGLVELEHDGTPKLDERGEPIPTYDQEIVEGFAHVFTGWSYAGLSNFRNPTRTVERQTKPMALYPDFHDTGPKQLLGGVTLPAGQTGEQDLRDALDNIFRHPNVGPFFSRFMIQRLVASNPSPEYVARVASAFDDNGHGERGDLRAVVKAMLLDEEARSENASAYPGKLKEPLLKLTQLWRAYHGKPTGERYGSRSYFRTRLGQGPLQAPSVFNFFSPFYSPPGELADADLVAPELEIATEYYCARFVRLLYEQCFRGNSAPQSTKDTNVLIDIDEELDIAGDAAALVDRVAHKLLGSRMSASLRSAAIELAESVQEPAGKVAEVIFIVAISPEFAVQT